MKKDLNEIVPLAAAEVTCFFSGGAFFHQGDLKTQGILVLLSVAFLALGIGWQVATKKKTNRSYNKSEGKWKRRKWRSNRRK